jgi:protein-S-isoprenylcysteine O-methyltransferase Ste14
MSGADNFFVRWRVRLGYPLAAAVLYFSRPTPRCLLLGTLAGVIGLWVRAYAAGYLHKQEVLTVTGPYAYTRNPLYLGSAILALGAGIATRSWISASILIVYFAVLNNQD